MYYQTVSQFRKLLGNLDKWLDAANEYAKSKSFDPNVLLNQRLAPDQFALARQVQITCDTAKLAAARLAGKEAPKQEDNETTIEQLRARIAFTQNYLGDFTERDFESAASRIISQPRWEGKSMNGVDYFFEHATPNFYFHLAHAYAILRHNGVNLGKKDYLGQLTWRTEK